MLRKGAAARSARSVGDPAEQFLKIRHRLGGAAKNHILNLCHTSEAMEPANYVEGRFILKTPCTPAERFCFTLLHSGVGAAVLMLRNTARLLLVLALGQEVLAEANKRPYAGTQAF